jgi:hypothetical protein
MSGVADDPSHMTSARRIDNKSDLARIHERGEGYVLYPFGRKLHSARCTSVPRMALNPNEPHWFAPDEDSARAYQRGRLASYRNAEPFERVGCCEVLIPADVLVHRDRGSSPVSGAPRDSSGDSGERRLWISLGRETGQAVELWTTRRTPFETDQSAQQKAMIRALAPRLQQLRCGEDDRLHGTFTSDEVQSRQPDAENITFFNFGSAPFVGASRALGFERSYEAAPHPPVSLEAPARYHHTWEVVPFDAPFRHWVERDTVAVWQDLPIDLGADLGLAAWRAVRENAVDVEVLGRLTAEDYFGITVTLTVPSGHQPSIVKSVKGLVDGPLAGLQRADTLAPDVMTTLIGRRWGRPMEQTTLAALVAARNPQPILPRPPFNRNGLDPCDELCVAGIARVATGGDRTAISGHVFRVTSR